MVDIFQRKIAEMVDRILIIHNTVPSFDQHLVHLLVQLDRDYMAASSNKRWEDYYARELVARLAPWPSGW